MSWLTASKQTYKLRWLLGSFRLVALILTLPEVLLSFSLLEILCWLRSHQVGWHCDSNTNCACCPNLISFKRCMAGLSHVYLWSVLLKPVYENEFYIIFALIHLICPSTYQSKLAYLSLFIIAISLPFIKLLLLCYPSVKQVSIPL